jgi:endoglucanase
MALRGKVVVAVLCALTTTGLGLEGAAAGSRGEQAKPPTCRGRVRAKPAVQPPLRTDGRWIVDAERRRVKLAGVNWYGAEERDEVVGGLDYQPLDRIAACIAAMGFNTVRLPFSNALVRDRRPLAEVAPDLTSRFVPENRKLLRRANGRPARPIDVYDKVVGSLARHGLLVILDNHMTANDWCCAANDGSSLWFDQFPGEHCAAGATSPCGPGGAFTEADWIADWRAMVRRFRREPAVVGVDLRNEVRPDAAVQPTVSPGWASGPAEIDWHRAATAAGNAVLAEDRDLLVIVEGLTYAVDLSPAVGAPIELAVRNRLVLSPHTYPWLWTPGASELPSTLTASWEPFLTGPRPVPVWLGEFGTNTTEPAQGWLDAVLATLERTEVGWSWWPLNGTQSSGRTRTAGARETFGLLDAEWREPANPDLTSRLRTLARNG